MPPHALVQPAHADSRHLDSRQALPVPLLEARQPESLRPSPEELTVRLLLGRNAPQALVKRDFGFETQYAGIDAGPAPGTVVGIVLGSVAGFLLLIWLLWIASSGGNSTVIRTEGEVEEVAQVRARTPKTRRARSRRTEVMSRASSPRRVYREEHVIRDLPRSRSPSVMRERDRSRVRETIIVEESRPERRFEGDDEVIVMEDHSSVGAPRRKDRRRSDRSVVEKREHGSERISGGYRTIDPHQFGGAHLLNSVYGQDTS